MNCQDPPVLPAVATKPVRYRTEHIVYDIADTRGDYDESLNALNTNIHSVRKAVNAGGDTIYLPFYANHITSTILPVPAPAGLTFFYTDNLSGCRFFVDTIAGQNDLIVYHANTTQHSVGANAWADVQTVPAGNLLDGMHANAQTDAPYAGMALTNAARLTMPRYFRNAGIEERRKGTGPQWRSATTTGAAAGRHKPEFLGGCFVCGFYTGAGWDFWFQTFGDYGYTRPGYVRGVLTFDWVGVHKRRTEGAEVTAGYANFNVVERVNSAGW
jgi:hypothetical protein